MKWYIATTLGLLVAYAVQSLVRKLVIMGVFETVYNQVPGPCRVIKVNGSEDIALLQTGQAFISSGLHDAGRGSVVHYIPPRDGNILLFDFNKPESNLKVIHLVSSSMFDPSQFNPHGLSHWQDPKSGKLWLFVVNHPVDGDAIEVFEYMPSEYALKHVRQVKHPLISTPNDLLAISENSFYFTNDHYFHHHLLKTLEGYWQLPISSVGFHNGETNETQLVAWSLMFPNGINMSPNGRFVYITTSTGIQLLIYKRNEADNSLTQVQVIQMADSCDNLFIHPITGDLWSGCHARIIDVIQHLYHNISHPSGSLVLRIRLGQENLSGQGEPFPDYEIDQIYSNDGGQLKGSSIAVYHGRNMLVGTVVDNLLYCEVRSLDEE